MAFRSFSALAISLLCSSAACAAGQPTPADIRSETELALISCLKAGIKESCWIKALQGKLPPWLADKEADSISKSEAWWKGWLGDGKVYGVYKVEAQVRGEIFDGRSFVVEKDDGSTAGLIIGFRRVAGTWYVGDLQGGDRQPLLDRILNMKHLQNAKD